LSGGVLEKDDESMSNKLLEVAADALTTADDEKSSQSKKTSRESGASKRKSSASASSSKASTPTKCRKMLSKHAKTPKARAEIDAETYSDSSDSEPSDQDDDKRKPAAVARTLSRQLLLPRCWWLVEKMTAVKGKAWRNSHYYRKTSRNHQPNFELC
jgi:hypothetical protein